MLRFLRFLSRDERGVSALEYSVLAGIVVVAVAAAGLIFGGATGLPALFSNMITHVTSVQTNGH
ncbi:Flp family type IVb pilin [Trinickia dabaoshanensis]|uniref:Flp family type IVb pilin n=1 Tax=Trinickia dabaoshanensis TaxID=564714 RepID=A0A2N7VJT4_9BURK|nr:Flp family type IVb pilin [Trinickia dabaoshanensis]PMS17421.1 Flp family type IVb pilin [Trinickia dabaoshanensis]